MALTFIKQSNLICTLISIKIQTDGDLNKAKVAVQGGPLTAYQFDKMSGQLVLSSQFVCTCSLTTTVSA
jgi:hypothetical protein